MGIGYKKERKERKERKGEKEVGFSFSARRFFFGKVGLAARMKGRTHIGEKRGGKEDSFGGFRDCLEEKHRGKDWQHASSSHLKPSNSSQRLVLPGMVM